MAALHLEKVETDRARFRALGADTVADRLPGILRHQGLQLCLGSLMLQKGLPRVPEETGKLRPGVRGAHVDDPDRLDPWLRWLNPEEARGLAALDAAPELPLSRDNEVLIERIGMGRDFDPFAAAGNHGQNRSSWLPPPTYYVAAVACISHRPLLPRTTRAA